MKTTRIEFYDIAAADESDPDPTFIMTTNATPTSAIARQLGNGNVSIHPTDESDKFIVRDGHIMYGTAYISTTGL